MNKEFDEDWIEHYAFVAYMIQYLERTAVEKGLATEEEVKEPPTKE
jgi:hypothetical protein